MRTAALIAVILAGCADLQPRAATCAPAPSLLPSPGSMLFETIERNERLQELLSASEAHVSECERVRSSGWRRVRQTQADAERFNGLMYAIVIGGERCWPDNNEWMWCETKPTSQIAYDYPVFIPGSGNQALSPVPNFTQDNGAPH